MCTIPDIDAALRELRRVLKPGGTLHFVEHGLAPDESVRAGRTASNPVQNRLFGGCNLNRPTIDLLARRRLRDRPGRLVLREGLAQVRRGEHARRGALRLAVCQRADDAEARSGLLADVEHRRQVSSRAIVGRDEPLRTLARLLEDAAAGRAAARADRRRARGRQDAPGRRARGARPRAGFLVLHGESLEFGGEEFPYAPVVAALRELPLERRARELDEDARGALAALLPRLRLEDGGRRVSGRFGQGRLYELAARAARPGGGDAAAADRAGGRALGRPLDARLRGVPRPQPAHRADRARAHVPHRRAAARASDAAARGRAGTPAARRRGSTSSRSTATTSPASSRRSPAAPVPAALADELHARAGGNPFFVEELFAARRDGGATCPATVADAVELRVAALSGPRAQLLAVVAAAGGQAAHAVLERCAPGRPRPAAARGARRRAARPRPRRRGRRAAARADRRGDLRRADPGGADRAAPRRSRRRCRRRARRRRSSPTSGTARAPCRRARRVAGGGRAGRATRTRSPRRARTSSGRSTLWDAVAPGGRRPRRRCSSRAAQAARYSGDQPRALALGRAALAAHDHAADPERAARLYERLGEYHSWDDEAALECYGSALALLGDEPTPVRARLLAAEGHALMGLRRWAESRERCEQALAVAAAAGDGAQAAAARITLGITLGFLGERRPVSAHLREALAAAERRGRRCARYVHLGELLRLRGDHAGRSRRWRRASARRRGSACAARSAASCTSTPIDDLLRLGRWDEAEARLQRGRAHGPRRDRRDDAPRERGAAARAARRGGAGPRAPRTRARLRGARAPGRVRDAVPQRGRGARARRARPGAAREHAATALAGPAEPLYMPVLLWLGVRAEADAAEAARVHRRAVELARADELLAAFPGGGAGALAYRALAEAERARAAGRAGRRVVARRRRTASTHSLSPTRPPMRACARRTRCSPAAATGVPRPSGWRRPTRPPSRSARGRCARTIEALARRARISPLPAAGAAPAEPADEALTRARGGRAGAARRRAHQPRDRRAAVHQREDRRHPHRPHLRQARRPQPRRGGGAGARDRHT